MLIFRALFIVSLTVVVASDIVFDSEMDDIVAAAASLPPIEFYCWLNKLLELHRNLENNLESELFCAENLVE